MLEPKVGIEPTSQLYESCVLPLNYIGVITRAVYNVSFCGIFGDRFASRLWLAMRLHFAFSLQKYHRKTLKTRAMTCLRCSISYRIFSYKSKLARVALICLTYLLQAASSAVPVTIYAIPPATTINCRLRSCSPSCENTPPIVYPARPFTVVF